MRSLIDAGKVQPDVINAAHSIVALTPEQVPPIEIRRIFDWTRSTVRYRRDVHGIETLATPSLTLRRRAGDCDDQTVLLCALLESIGHPTRLVLAAYGSEAFEHVYCQVWDGSTWVDCEPIESCGFLGFAYPDPVRLWIEPR